MTNDTLDSSDDFKDQTNANEIELRELIHQALEQRGFLANVKAQIRAAIFQTVEDSSNSVLKPILTNENDNSNGPIIRGLFLDWLEHTHLLYTKDVFQVESATTKTFDRQTLIDKLRLTSIEKNSLPLIEFCIKNRHDDHQITKLPQYVKQSIDSKFPSEKISDLNLVREHFRSLFSASFDISILDIYINKMLLSSSSSSILKSQYEQICLKWLQSCSQVLNSSSINTVKSNGQIVSRARRDVSLFADSTSSSASSSPVPEQ